MLQWELKDDDDDDEISSNCVLINSVFLKYNAALILTRIYRNHKSAYANGSL
jgi:hypothetical protein